MSVRAELDKAYTQAAVSAGPLCDRMLRLAVEEESVEVLARQCLAEMAAELSASLAALFRRIPDWRVIYEFGRRPGAPLPQTLFDEAQDREAAAYASSAPAGSPAELLVVPTLATHRPAEVVVFSGTAFSDHSLPTACVLVRTANYGLTFREQISQQSQRASRFQHLLQIVSGFPSASDTGKLLELIAAGATELLNCDRASIFIWDREQHQVVACPALGLKDTTLRLSDKAGIVGEVLRSGQSIRVEDAYQSPHFDRSVDQETGYRTRSLLCVPMRDEQGRLLGAFQALNKQQGLFTNEDEECLTLLAVQAAVAIKSTRERERLLRSHQQLTQRATEGARLIGQSPAIQALRKTIDRLAETDLPVLILGESGTGKEVVAQALHYQGPRADRPFIAVNCAALTESLLESELFGYERGAFTDARETRLGKFEIADGGTLFLDEIGEMSLAGQAKLLRVLEQKVVTRVGGSDLIPIDVRVVAATNANLEQAVREKRFREDLYYRLNVVTLELPPLRDRPEDIVPLAEHFLVQFCAQARRQTLELSEEAKRRLTAYAWPGNVRELRNLMERFAFLSAGDRIEAEDVSFLLSPERDTDQPLAAATRQFQQEYIRRAIKRAGGNMSLAAKLLGLHRANLYRKMKQLGMSVDAAEESIKPSLP